MSFSRRRVLYVDRGDPRDRDRDMHALVRSRRESGPIQKLLALQSFVPNLLIFCFSSLFDT